MLCVIIRIAYRGDSNEYVQHTIINIKKKIILNYPKYDIVCSYGSFFLGTQERVRNGHDGKRDIGVRATELLLYINIPFLKTSL